MAEFWGWAIDTFHILTYLRQTAMKKPVWKLWIKMAFHFFPVMIFLQVNNYCRPKMDKHFFFLLYFGISQIDKRQTDNPGYFLFTLTPFSWSISKTHSTYFHTRWWSVKLQEKTENLLCHHIERLIDWFVCYDLSNFSDYLNPKNILSF